VDRAARNLGLLWVGQFVSATGDALFLVAVAWLAGRVGGDGAAVGHAVFLAAVPFLLFGVPAGALADRWDRRRLMIASDVARALVLLLLPVAAGALGGLSLGLLAGAAFLVSTLATPFGPARDALLPDLAEGASLARWNALVQTSVQVAQVLGLLLGGVVLSALASGGGSETRAVLLALQYHGATFLVSAAALAFVAVPPRPPLRSRPPFLEDVRAGLRYARRDRVVGSLLLLTALNNLALMGPAMVGPTLLLQKDLGLGVGHLAWFEAAMAGGMLVGALGIAKGARGMRADRLLLVGMVLDGLTYLPFLWLPSYPWLVAAIFLHGVFIPWIVVGRTSLLQAHAPPEARGRTFALVGLTVSGMSALSAALSGWMAAAVGARGLFGLAGALGALSGVAGILAAGPALAAAAVRTPRR
jgi:MFS family permease